MKVCIVGPGIMPIPPTGWGAVEILIHDLRCELESAGHEVVIVNVKEKQEIIRLVNESGADFVHIHYDDHVDIVPHILCPKVAITSHCPYLESPSKWDDPYKHIVAQFLLSGADVFALSPEIADVYKSLVMQNASNLNLKLSLEKIHVVHNGVRTDLFSYKDAPAYPDRSICLAKVEPRKRQRLLQSIPDLYYAGNLHDDQFNSPLYLGEWSKEYLYDNLTDYANLVLLSDGEAHPLVCMEALSAGLGLVLSEFAYGNLDPSLPFIDIVPEKLMNNPRYIEKVIRENAAKSLKMRKQIKEYAETFSWKNVVKDKYLPAIGRVVPRT